MDDFGNIIYILAAIGWFFWNAYKKTQQGKEKKTTQPNRRSEPQPAEEVKENPFKSLEDMILEQIGEKEDEPKPVPVETVSTKPAQHRSQDKFLSTNLTHSHLDADYQMSVSESKSHRVQRQVKRLNQTAEEKEQSLMDELFPDEGFDLRKAVVLDAILNRPYA